MPRHESDYDKPWYKYPIPWIVLGLCTLMCGMFALDYHDKVTREEQEAYPPGLPIRVPEVLTIALSQPGSYIIQARDTDNTLTEILVCYKDVLKYTPCKFVLDVPPGKPMWMTYQRNRYGYTSNAVVHIHGGSSFIGAGWTENCGKGCLRQHQTTILDAANP